MGYSNRVSFFIIVMHFAACNALFKAQTPADACIRLTVTYPKLHNTTLSWWAPPNAQPAIVRVKRMHSTNWLHHATVLTEPYSITISDTLITEIEIQQVWTVNEVTFAASGYMALNKQSTAVTTSAHRRVLVVVEDNIAQSLIPELHRLTDDLIREGWIVHTALARSDVSPKELKSQVVHRYYADSAYGQLTHVFLIGHLPYATSGGFFTRGTFPNPDFHPEHGGAWASDAYYADMTTSSTVGAEYQWTDFQVNITSDTVASRPENKNIPGDGKFDQSMIPTDLELCVGRLDMWDLPTFGVIPGSDRSREVALIKQYLQRNHEYRRRAFEPPNAALIDDNFGLFSRVQNGLRITEAFATSGWRSFSAIVSADNVFEGDWIPDATNNRFTLDTGKVLLAYGCGGGGYEHCSYVGDTREFAQYPLHAVFTLLFGSYFGDVNSTNNVMRATLANNGWVLASGWAGRPHWFLHPLAAGATIGECFRLSANNANTYLGSTYMDVETKLYDHYPLGNRGIHVMLLGDPTLTLQGPVMDGSVTVANNSDGTSTITFPGARFTAGSSDETITYLVEGATSSNNPFNLLHTELGSNKPEYSVTLTLHPSTTVIRVRPVLRSETTAGPLCGRGLLSASGIISRVADNTNKSEQPLGIPIFTDILGRVFTGSPDQLPPGLWLISVPGQSPCVYKVVR